MHENYVSTLSVPHYLVKRQFSETCTTDRLDDLQEKNSPGGGNEVRSGGRKR